MATTFSTPGCALHARGDVVERARGALQRGALGKLHDDEEVALVLDRQEAGRHAAQAVHGEADEAGDDQRHQPAAPDHAPDEAGVGVLQRVIDAVEAAIEEVALLGRRHGAQPQRALRRLQGHGVDGAMISAVAAMTSANWRYIWPDSPGRKAAGTNTAISTSVMPMIGPEQLVHRLDGRHRAGSAHARCAWPRPPPR